MTHNDFVLRTISRRMFLRMIAALGAGTLLGASGCTTPVQVHAHQPQMKTTTHPHIPQQHPRMQATFRAMLLQHLCL